MTQFLRLPRPLSAMRAFGVASGLAAAAFTFLIAACSDPSTPVGPIGGHLSLGKAPAGPSVSSALPSYAHRDTTLNIRILGSGFTAGAAAEWALGGVANPAKVRTNSTQFVSASELVANITVSADADLAFWDITVMLVGGKKGVGTEKFEVTTATILGAGTIGGDMRVETANDLLSAVGYAGAADAFVYDSYTSTLVALGAGQAWGIDPMGTTALGRDGAFLPVYWQRGISGAWTRQALPGGGLPGIATRAAVASDGSLQASGWLTVEASRRESFNHPVLWRRIDGAWVAPLEYVIPGVAAAGYDVSASGGMAGRSQFPGNTFRGVVWDSPTTYTLLDGIAYGMNDAGTIVVGDRNGAPTYWYRDGTGAWVATGVSLPGIGSCQAPRALDANNAGVIVGASCAPNGKRVATVWTLDLSVSPPVLVQGPIRLGGLGVVGSGAEQSGAAFVTSSPPYMAVGGAVASSTLLVSWQVP